MNKLLEELDEFLVKKIEKWPNAIFHKGWGRGDAGECSDFYLIFRLRVDYEGWRVLNEKVWFGQGVQDKPFPVECPTI